MVAKPSRVEYDDDITENECVKYSIHQHVWGMTAYTVTVHALTVSVCVDAHSLLNSQLCDQMLELKSPVSSLVASVVLSLEPRLWTCVAETALHFV
jgi:hypothetical protein